MIKTKTLTVEINGQDFTIQRNPKQITICTGSAFAGTYLASMERGAHGVEIWDVATLIYRTALGLDQVDDRACQKDIRPIHEMLVPFTR